MKKTKIKKARIHLERYWAKPRIVKGNPVRSRPHLLPYMHMYTDFVLFTGYCGRLSISFYFAMFFVMLETNASLDNLPKSCVTIFP